MKKFLIAVLFTAFIGVGFAVEIRSDFLYSLVLRVIAEGEISPDEMITILTACEKNNKKLGKQCGEVFDQLVETEVK
jgi:MOSC domain-containing protein YiiM